MKKLQKNVKIKQLVTLKRSKKDDTLKISESSADAKLSTRLQLQLTAYKTKRDNTNLKETSKFTAKKVKSIIPARRLFSLNRHNGSLMKKDSSKELGPLDNTSKNTSLITQNYLNDNLNNLNNPTSSKEATKNHQTHQPLHEKNPLTTNNIHDPNCLLYTSPSPRD